MNSLNLSLQGKYIDFPKIIETNSSKEKVLLLIMRDLMRLGWSVNFLNNQVQLSPPQDYDKALIRQSMSFKRTEILLENQVWIERHIDLARNNLADGREVLLSHIQPIVEVCRTRKQHALFRIFRYYWSSPYSEYVGRRIKLIIRDASLSNSPVIGIAALGSPIIHIPERDGYIGWDKVTRTANLNYMMDAYVVGALPPYSYLLGGKLISYLLTSNEVRDIYCRKYGNTNFDKLAGLFTTSLYGRSSQYNRLKIRDRLLYVPIGETKGFGTLHITSETFNAMNDFLKEQGVVISNKFGDGPIWSMRVIRHAGRLLGFNPEHLLMHSFKRKIYFVPFARNTQKFLNGQDKHLRFYRQNINTLTNYWKKRWYRQRKQNHDVLRKVEQFQRESFLL